MLPTPSGPSPRRKVTCCRGIRAPMSLAVSLALALAAAPQALAAVPRMPGVTEQMSEAAFWSGKVKGADVNLATPAEIDDMNARLLATPATNMHDLRAWPESSFDGVAYGSVLRQAAADDARYMYESYGAVYDGSGHHYETYEEMHDAVFAPIIANCQDADATTEEPIRFGIATSRGYILTLPSDVRLLDDTADPDFDYMYQTAVRLGEPLIVKGVSNDGQYLHVFSSCTAGWIRADQVGLCDDRASWLESWDFEAARTLVVCAASVRTDESNYAPETSDVTLTMGTCLELADGSSADDILTATNRSGHNNHVVWLPVRGADGSLVRRLALVPEGAHVHEGYLPVTIENILDVSFNFLGHAYGWGGMLGSEDCSGFVRDVYRCFGLDLPRNTTWQAAAPDFQIDLSKMSDDEKAAAIATLPPGATLFFNGHEMTYLGSDGGGLYVISSMSSARLGEEAPVSRIRLCAVSELSSLRRRNDNTWLSELDTAAVPFLAAGHAPWSDASGQRISKR